MLVVLVEIVLLCIYCVSLSKALDPQEQSVFSHTMKLFTVETFV